MTKYAHESAGRIQAMRSELRHREGEVLRMKQLWKDSDDRVNLLRSQIKAEQVSADERTEGEI